MRWTLDLLREANACTAERWTWAHDPESRNQFDGWPLLNVRWDVIIYVQRLCWMYEEDGALQRLNGQMARAAA